MNRRRPPLVLVLLLLGLVAAFDVQAPHAALNIVWRFAVLSFDNPATQWLDELASGASPCTDPAGEARGWIRPAVSRRPVLERTSAAAGRATLGSGFTRSPPGT